MRWTVVLSSIGLVIANYGAQNSGYEAAEREQSPPSNPPSADGGDQQGYNSDGKQSDSTNSHIPNIGGSSSIFVALQPRTDSVDFGFGGANDAPRYGNGGTGGQQGFNGMQSPGIAVFVPGVETNVRGGQVPPQQPYRPSYPYSNNNPSYPGQGGQGIAPAPYRDTQQQLYPSNYNYQQNERMNPAPQMSASGGDGLAYSNEVRLRALRF
ncbi:unnamed protein product [Nippostrongylus brasiliensis]|uniref:Secreted protein n=1 Tax=Nippostrongylus brasiliensis TaxID=27835 RepID=A0A0N4XJG6_NIPBR|nr:unnamed protein product [Nippostrongylus brasiliensis]